MQQLSIFQDTKKGIPIIDLFKAYNIRLVKEPMGMDAHNLERWFNCNIYFSNNYQLRKCKYTGTIEIETMREALERRKVYRR